MAYPYKSPLVSHAIKCFRKELCLSSCFDLRRQEVWIKQKQGHLVDIHSVALWENPEIDLEPEKENKRLRKKKQTLACFYILDQNVMETGWNLLNHLTLKVLGFIWCVFQKHIRYYQWVDTIWEIAMKPYLWEVRV